MVGFFALNRHENRFTINRETPHATPPTFVQRARQDTEPEHR